ncbi:MAG: helix-turn-helix transcriptional regulator [Bryobacterales bacterium]|nr:helix-turn-helix transcriptional regulator [Bryobacterales bacterium]
MLIDDPERQRPASTQALMQIYKLTRKEAALAVKLSEGRPLERAAEELSITYDTARTHLRRIFSKTGTSRQAELLMLIARLPVIEDGGSGG